MEDTGEFYEKRHQQETDYAGGSYKVDQLLGIRAISRWCALRRDGSVSFLDVGCGKGVFSRDFLSAMKEKWNIAAKSATGVDVVESPGNVFKQISPSFDLVRHNLDKVPIPLPDCAFDIISCNHVLEHVFNTESLVKEIFRMLRPGGLAVISVPNIAAWINRLLFLFACQPLGSEVGAESITYGFWPRIGQKHLEKFIASGHIRDFTPRALEDMTIRWGFRCVGWWNQDEVSLFRLTRWAGRGVGIILTK